MMPPRAPQELFDRDEVEKATLLRQIEDARKSSGRCGCDIEECA